MRALLAVLLASALSASAASPVHVRVYHTNDVHGWFMPRPDKLQPERRVGGAAAFAALLAKEQGPRLVLDAGDWWQGTPEGSLTKGAAAAEIFNAVGYDALVIGNHEYDAGQDALRSLVGRMNASVLSANTYGADGKRVPWAKPWIMKTVAGVKFGIFGLTTTKISRLVFPKNIAGLSFRREIDEARDAVAALRRERADVIIALTHIGVEQEGRGSFEGDQALAREVEGIDLIVGGHSHTYLIRSLRINGVLIVQAGNSLTKAGRVDLEIDPKTRKILSSSSELIDLFPDRVGEDPTLKEIVARQAQEAGSAFELVVATAAAPLNRDSTRESALGDWMTDCYRLRTGADAAFQNPGGIRADIPAGPLSLRGIFSVMPFDNGLVTLRMKGADVKDVLEHGLGPGRVLQASGVAVRYRPSHPPGARVASAELAGAPLDFERVYSVAALDFMTDGGDGFTAFERFVSSDTTGVLARDALIDCARTQVALTPPPGGRLRLLED